MSSRAPWTRVLGGVWSQVALGHRSAGCPLPGAVGRWSPKPWAVWDDSHFGMRQGWDPVTTGYLAGRLA